MNPIHLLLAGVLVSVCLAAAAGLPDFDRLWDYARADRTEAAFRELLPRAREAEDGEYLAGLLTQIARTQGLQRRFEEAHRTLDEADGLLSPETPVARVRCLLERGRVLNSSGQGERARPLFRQAWEEAERAGAGTFALDAAHMLGIVEPPDEALLWNEKAIALAEASPEDAERRWLGPLYNNTGWTCYDRGDYARALSLLQKALDFYQQHGKPVQVRIARYAVGKTLRALGRVEEALAIQAALREAMEAEGDPDGYVYEEVAECLLLLAQNEEARGCFAKAHDLLSRDRHLAEHEPDRLRRLKEQGGR